MLIELLLTQTAKITPFVRYGSGEPLYGTPETRKCRIDIGVVEKNQTMGANGNVQTDGASGGTKMFCIGEAIAPLSIVECDGSSYVVATCIEHHGFGQRHLEVTFK